MARRNVMPRIFPHPNEFVVWSQAAADFGQPFLQCPHCGRKVSKLFAMAHAPPEGARESEELFERGQGVMCGLDIATLLSDTDAVILGAKKK